MTDTENAQTSVSNPATTALALMGILSMIAEFGGLPAPEKVQLYRHDVDMTTLRTLAAVHGKKIDGLPKTRTMCLNLDLDPQVRFTLFAKMEDQ